MAKKIAQRSDSDLALGGVLCALEELRNFANTPFGYGGSPQVERALAFLERAREALERAHVANQAKGKSRRGTGESYDDKLISQVHALRTRQKPWSIHRIAKHLGKTDKVIRQVFERLNERRLEADALVAALRGLTSVPHDTRGTK